MDYIAISMYNVVMRQMQRNIGKYPLIRAKPPVTTLPYCVHTVGKIQNQPYHITLGTYYDDVMFLLFVDGHGIYRREGKTVQTGSGMAGLILPSNNPGLLKSSSSDPYEHYYCRFAGEQAKKVAQRIIDENGGRAFFKWDKWREGAEVLQRMCSMWRLQREVMKDRMRLVDALLAELLAILDWPAVSKSPRLSADTFEHYMQTHISEPLSLQEIADHFCVSKYHLCRIAKKNLGEPLIRRWERMKVNWAMMLLREPNMSIQEVARHVGYEDAFYFSRVFKNHTGLSPRNWRKRLLDE